MPLALNQLNMRASTLYGYENPHGQQQYDYNPYGQYGYGHGGGYQIDPYGQHQCQPQDGAERGDGLIEMFYPFDLGYGIQH